jgi:hypothetical protein
LFIGIKGVILMADNEKKFKINSDFISPQERMIQLGLVNEQEDRPIVRGENFSVEPGRVTVGRIDTTRKTLK